MMNQFSGIFFHMRTGNADTAYFPIHFHVEIAMFTDWQVKLGSLEILRKVRIVIILSVKFAETGDFAVQCQSGTHSKFKYFLIQHRQYAWKSQTYRADIGIRVCTKRGFAVTENLCGRMKLCMHFKPNYCFVFHAYISPFGAVFVNSG